MFRLGGTGGKGHSALYGAKWSLWVYLEREKIACTQLPFSVRGIISQFQADGRGRRDNNGGRPSLLGNTAKSQASRPYALHSMNVHTW